jgi:spore maturation protein CgeB
LQSGAGLKIKVLEAMACGKVVIGSKLSFEGINISHEKHAIVASTAEEYIPQIEKYINSQSERKLIEKNAQQLIQMDFNISNNVNKWKQVIEGNL